MPAGELKEFAGFYAPRAPWVQLFAFSDGLLGVIHIRVINDQIFRSGMFDAPQPLLPAGKNLFRGENEPEASTVFFKDETGKMVMADAEFSGIAYAERIHPVWPCAGLALFVLCFFLMLTSLLFALAWIPRKLQGKMTEVRHLAVRSAPLLATLAMASVPYCFTRVRGIGMGTANPWTVGILFGSALFPIFSVIGLILALHVPKNEIQAGVRIHSLLVSIACCVVAGFLGSWHLIGLRLWAP